MRVLKKELWPYSITIPLLESEVENAFDYLNSSGQYVTDWTYHFIGTSSTVRVYSKDREFITLLKLRYDHAFITT